MNHLMGKQHILFRNKCFSFKTAPASAQVVEVRAVAAVFQELATVAFNLYTDSHYVAKTLQVLKTVVYVDTANVQVRKLFLQILQRIHDRKHPYFVGHIRAHTGLPGPLAAGNALPAQNKFQYRILESILKA